MLVMQEFWETYNVVVINTREGQFSESRNSMQIDSVYHVCNNTGSRTEDTIGMVS